ncbi:S1 RNA-binding domain-containing protein [Candidatus Woesearchaeota archaeon]|nr:S1 RNA-binding domain-containing protein [Candidatus Woesearchaeota archaeon]
MLYRREGYPGEDELVLCTVTKVLGHAVFVNLDEYDKGGLVHISEVAPGRIRNIREYVELGKKIVCKVLRTNLERGHIDLSLRRVSDKEKKNKLEAIKQEQKAEKVVEMAAKQINMNTKEVYEIVTGKAFERYPFLYNFFKDIAEGNVQAKELIADAKLADILQGLVTERFRPAKIAIKGTFTVRSFAPNGVEAVKEALTEAQKKGKKASVTLLYMGGGKYKVTIEAENYKDAEQALEKVQESVEGSITDGEVAFKREEA